MSTRSNERRPDLTASIDAVLATATTGYDLDSVDDYQGCIECHVPVLWLDGQPKCPNGNCPMGDPDMIVGEDECDWPDCTGVIFHINTRRKTARCHIHKTMPAWPDGRPRIALPGQETLL